MLWTICILALVLALAYFIRKAVNGTVFRGKCPCTPYIEHLRWLESKSPEDNNHKKENLW